MTRQSVSTRPIRAPHQHDRSHQPTYDPCMVRESKPRPVAPLAPPQAPPAHPLRQFVLITLALGLVVAAMALPIVGSGAIAARNAARAFESLPSALDAPPPPTRSTLLASDGSKIGEIAYENRVQVPLNAVSL